MISRGLLIFGLPMNDNSKQTEDDAVNHALVIVGATFYTVCKSNEVI